MRPRQVGAALALACSLFAGVVSAQPTEAEQKEANTHFQRAVQLYSEADYRAALVEFKRAYEIAPHPSVLYNIGEAYYQLQNYAEALNTFEKFIADGGTNHKAEVENTISILKTRVGKVDISTPSPGWDIAIDDEQIGKTPLPKPVAVSIGKRKVTASKAGETSQTKFVEVAAGDTKPLVFDASAPAGTTKVDTTTGPVVEQKKSSLYMIGWITTGVLAAGAVTTGIIAGVEAGKLSTARNAFPGNKSDIDSKASTTTAFAVTADVLGIAAIVVGGIDLYFTLTRPKSAPATGATTGIRFGGEPGKFTFGGSF